MPGKSAAKHRHNPAFEKKVGAPQSVGIDYVRAASSHPSLSSPGGIVKSGSYLEKKHR